MNLKESQNVKLVVFVPETHADIIRNTLAQNGAGKIGNYDSCSFSVKGTSRFRPIKGSNPNIGELYKIESVIEEKIECIISINVLEKCLTEIKKVHPYEEIGFDIYPLLEITKEFFKPHAKL